MWSPSSRDAYEAERVQREKEARKEVRVDIRGLILRLGVDDLKIVRAVAEGLLARAL